MLQMETPVETSLLVIKCSKCQFTLALTEFPKNKKCSLGVEKTCRSCQREYKRNSYHKNKDEWKAYSKKYYLNHKDQYKIRGQLWCQKNSERRRLYSASYRQAVKRAHTNWTNKQEIKQFYDKCPAGHHVDHIVPLQGKLVCGLHVIENLQYLPKTENLCKGNSWMI